MSAPFAPKIVVDTSQNSSFSKILPGLQLAVDSTSLGTYKTCPRLYYYSIIMGLQPRTESVHLTFGILLHGAREHYDHFRTQGQEHQQALRNVLRWLMSQTWNKELQRGWDSDHRTKNRLTLVQTAVWYLDEFGENDPLETVQLASGKPAVELSFSFNTGLVTGTGEPIVFCGHLDRIAKLNGVTYIVDLKSTERTLDPGFFKQFSPDNQFSMYVTAGRVAFGQPINDLLVDGVQVAVGFSRFMRAPVPRSDSQLEEWFEGTQVTLGQMEQSARSGIWPLNEKSCGNYGGCKFREICSRPPSAREPWLKAEFKVRVWDPLQRRGDI